MIVLGTPEATCASTPCDPIRAGRAEAVRHLHAVGRRRIALVNGPQQTVPGTARRLGYLDGLRSCGLERREELCVVADDFMVEPGRRGGRAPARASPARRDLLRQRPARRRHACRAARCPLDVPGDVAVVGMDNTALSELTWPPLTTIDLGSAERARIAAELLFRRIEDPDPRREHQRRAGARRARIVGRRSANERRSRAPPARSAPRAEPGGRQLSGREALILLIPALIPVILLSVVPLLRGMYLGFTDSRAGLGVDTHFIGLDNFHG